MLPEVTDTIIMTANKIEAPSSQPYFNPSVAIPSTKDTKAAAQRILSISSSKFSKINSMIVLGGLTMG